MWVERREVLVGARLETQAHPGLQVEARSNTAEMFDVTWFKCVQFLQDKHELIFFKNNHNRSNWPARLQSSRPSRSAGTPWTQWG